MFKNLSNLQLMIIYLGSKAWLEKNSKPEAYQVLSQLSHELKTRRYTNFRGWQDFSNQRAAETLAMRSYENRLIFHSFSRN